jgi:exopolyphosphatase/guanosine-5'-triphosphate,3'-diphosphate pyrophosphatase
VSTVAAVDCGTNSLRLLVTDGEEDLLRRMEIVRLGQGVDTTGELAAEALERTRKVLEDYALEITRLGATRTRMVATSATRDARNRDVFVAMVRDTLGVEPEVISGAEEASLSFRGATHGLAVTEPVLVCDIGGGSTELVRGTDRVDAALSVDVGCVRLAERHGSDVDALVADAQRGVDQLVAAVPVDGATDLVCLAGTATTVAALALGLKAYDPDRIHLARIPVAQLEEVTTRLVRASRDEIASWPVVHPGRVDVITAGALVLRTVVRSTGFDSYVASEADILDGIALSLEG